MCSSIHDSSTVCNGRQKWYPLETVLEAWLDMFKRGKVKATGEKGDHSPWSLLEYSENDLKGSVEVFNKLVEAIESRIPQPDTKTGNTTDSRLGLVDEHILNSLNKPHRDGQNRFSKYRFAYDFIQRVRRPRFRFIAPGLEIPTESTFIEQPFFSREILNDADAREKLQWSDEDPIPPLCLFRSSQQAPPFTMRAPNLNPFGWP